MMVELLDNLDFILFLIGVLCIIILLIYNHNQELKEKQISEQQTREEIISLLYQLINKK
jgi:hypothetical protein